MNIVARRGRPPVTTHTEIERIALTLFAREGFEATTVDEIAAAVGLNRRTLFRYFPSKNDIVWGDFESVMTRLRHHLHETAGDVPLTTALRLAVVASNSYPPEELPALRTRMRLITSVPSLQAHSMLRYEAWRNVVAEFAAARLGQPVDHLVPQAIGHAALGASMAAFSCWVRHPEQDLEANLHDAFELLERGLVPRGSAR